MALESFPSTTSEPLMPYDDTPEINVTSFRAEDGTEETTTEWAAERETRKLVFRCDKTDHDTLKAFYIARSGQLEAFEFTCPLDSATYTMRFDPKGCSFRQVLGIRFEVTLSLYETNE